MERIFLCKDTVFFQSETRGWMVYKNGTGSGYGINEATVKILELSDGTRSRNEILTAFDISIRTQVGGILEFLLEEQILEERENCYGYSKDRNQVTTFYLSLTHNCNLRCSFCLKDRQTQDDRELSVNEWKTLIDNVWTYNKIYPKTLYLTGGEPTYHTGFSEIYRYALEKGFIINIFTNGTLLNEKLVHLFREQPPNAFLISIDGSSEKIHDEQRGVKGSYSRMLEATRELLKIPGVHVIWQTVINTANLEDMENLVSLGIETGVKNIRFSLVSSIGMGKENAGNLSIPKMAEFYQKVYYLTKEYKERITVNRPLSGIESGFEAGMISCGLGNILHINERGHVTPCYGMKCSSKTYDFFHKRMEDFKECAKCGIRFLCHGGCKAEILEVCKDIHGCVREKKEALTMYLDGVV